VTKASVKPKDILALLHKQGFRCEYTGDELTPETVAADHMLPVSRGGGHDLENIALVTRVVNSAKGTMTVAEFVGMCRKVVGHIGGKTEWARDDAEEVVAVGSLAGTSDPVEILARLGHVEAAESVRAMRDRNKKLEGYLQKRGRLQMMTPGMLEDDRRGKVEQLQLEIQRLRVCRSQLRSQILSENGSLPDA
jgi:hypothetical protein